MLELELTSRSGQRSVGESSLETIRRILLYSVCRSKQMEPTLSNWPCTSFPVGCRELMHVLWILLHDEIVVEARDAIEDQVRAIVKEGMEEPFREDHPSASPNFYLRRS